MNGVCGIKVFMGSSTETCLSMSKTSGRYLREYWGIIATHAEDESTSDSNSEYAHRTDIAAHAECRDECAQQRSVPLVWRVIMTIVYIVHLTSAKEADWLVGIKVI